jgi:prepilin-type N-terminal cleavage/methylation domain-containing protein
MNGKGYVVESLPRCQGRPSRRFGFRGAARTIHAFTLIELMVVVACVALLALMYLPATTGPKEKAMRSRCVNNLKQMGLSFRTWEGDHDDKYPMLALTNADGTRTLLSASNIFRCFQLMSNQLNNPQILVCPSDDRLPADNFAALDNLNLSYFVGVDADETFPAMFLAGDRNLTNGTKVQNGVLELTTNQPAGFTKDLHNGFGNILLSDGSVQWVDARGLNALIAKTGLATNRLVMP